MYLHSWIWEVADNLQPQAVWFGKLVVKLWFMLCTTPQLLTSNAFNSLNQRVSLHNLHYIYPPLAVTLTNVYREAASLFINGESLSTVPLIQRLEGIATQVWFADDAAD